MLSANFPQLWIQDCLDGAAICGNVDDPIVENHEAVWTCFILCVSIKLNTLANCVENIMISSRITASGSSFPCLYFVIGFWKSDGHLSVDC